MSRGGGKSGSRPGRNRGAEQAAHDRAVANGYEFGTTGEVYDEMDNLGLSGDPSTWNMDQVEAYEDLIVNRTAPLESRELFEKLETARKRKDELEKEERLDELLSSMEMQMSRLAEASAYQPPYQQPASTAQQTYTEAQVDSARRQNLRRGLLSLTRYGSNSSTSSSGLSGKSSRLGG